MGKKPTGERTSAILSHVGTAAHVAFNKLDFPETKAEIERLVIQVFDRSLDEKLRRRFGITNIRQISDENDLDCRINGIGGDWKMDLAEFVPGDLSRAGYRGAPHQYTNGDLADKAIEVIRSKDAKYTGLDRPWLLLYTTAWQFAPSENSHLIVSDALVRKPPKLGRTMFMHLFTDLTAKITTLHPVDVATAIRALGSDLRSLRSNIVTNRDVRDFQPSMEDGKATFWLRTPDR